MFLLVPSGPFPPAQPSADRLKDADTRSDLRCCTKAVSQRQSALGAGLDRHRRCHGPRLRRLSAGLPSTRPLGTAGLFIEACASICPRMHVCRVFARWPRRGRLIRAADIRQRRHFLPFCVQSKHTTPRPISAPWDAERPDLCDLSVRNYAMVTPAD